VAQEGASTSQCRVFTQGCGGEGITVVINGSIYTDKQSRSILFCSADCPAGRGDTETLNGPILSRAMRWCDAVRCLRAISSRTGQGSGKDPMQPTIALPTTTTPVNCLLNKRPQVTRVPGPRDRFVEGLCAPLGVRIYTPFRHASCSLVHCIVRPAAPPSVRRKSPTQ
jgi:hypothetical protein